MGATLSPPLIDGSYLDAGRVPTLTARISMPAINAINMASSLAMEHKT
jgi:hypothetical protein